MDRFFLTFGHLHQWHTKLAKVGPKFSKIGPEKIVQDFQDFAKMAKIRQSWSQLSMSQSKFLSSAEI